MYSSKEYYTNTSKNPIINSSSLCGSQLHSWNWAINQETSIQGSRIASGISTMLVHMWQVQDVLAPTSWMSSFTFSLCLLVRTAVARLLATQCCILCDSQILSCCRKEAIGVPHGLENRQTRKYVGPKCRPCKFLRILWPVLQYFHFHFHFLGYIDQPWELKSVWRTY